MLRDAFIFAHRFVSSRGFSEEIEWQNSVSFDLLEESAFLREYAWVVLASGMREAVVRAKFPLISETFYFWESAERIARDAEACVQGALRVFRHEPKVRAIASTSALIASRGFERFRQGLRRGPMETLRTLPYIGAVTQYHLAKNIGLDVAKPDRHLVRIAGLFGFPSVDGFCRAVALEAGSRIAVVDLVFWRFATLERNYLDSLLPFR